MKRLLKLGLIVTAFAFLGAGCGDDESEDQTLRFLFSPKNTSNDVFRPATNLAQTKAKSLTDAANGFKVVVELASGTAENVADQRAAIEAAIADTTNGEVAGLAISAVSGQDPAWLESLGIPVVFWDSKVTKNDGTNIANELTFYSVDNATAAAKAAANFDALLPDPVGAEKLQLAVLVTDFESGNIYERARGLMEAADATKFTFENPGGAGGDKLDGKTACAAGQSPVGANGVLECGYIDCSNPNGNPVQQRDAECAEAVDKFIEANPNVRGIFFSAVWMRIYARTLEFPAGTITCGGLTETAGCTGHRGASWRAWTSIADNATIAFDSFPEALVFVPGSAAYDAFATANPGADIPTVASLLGQKYGGWGADPIQILFDNVTAGTVPTKNADGLTDSGIDEVCDDNVTAYEEAWASFNFSLPLTTCDYTN